MKQDYFVQDLLIKLRILKTKNHDSLSVDDLKTLEKVIAFLEEFKSNCKTIDGKTKFLEILPDLLRFIVNPKIWKVLKDLFDGITNL